MASNLKSLQDTQIKVIRQQVLISQKLDFLSDQFKGKPVGNKETNFLKLLLKLWW